MAVTEQIPEIAFVANGATSTFPFPFKIPTVDDLLVAWDGVERDDGFAVSGLGTSAGNVIFAPVPADGVAVTIQRSTRLQRPTDYQQSGDFLSPVVNADFDRLMFAIQEIAAESHRGIRAAVGEAGLTLLPGAQIPNRVLGTDADGVLGLLDPDVLPPAGGTLPALYQAPGLGAIARLLTDLFDDVVSVTNFMSPAQKADCRSNSGALDSSGAWQAAINFATLKGNRKIRAPAGSYRLDSAVTITNADVSIEGDGQEATRILVNNATGGIFFSQASRTGEQGTAYFSGVKSLSIISIGGDVIRGKALSIIYSTPSSVPGVANVLVSDVTIRSAAYISPVGRNRFAVCLYIKDAHGVIVEKFAAIQIGNPAGTLIFLDYSVTTPGFCISLRSLNLNGCLYGIRALGWMENLQIIDFNIVSGYGMYIDASGIADVKPPVLSIVSGHVNGCNRTISVINWVSIQIDAVNVYIAELEATTETLMIGAFFSNCSFIEWTGGLMGSVGGGSNGATLMLLAGCANGTVTGMIGLINNPASGTQRGVQIDSGSSRLTLTGNQVVSNVGLADAGIFVQTNSVGSNDQIVISGNTVSGFGSGVTLVNESGVKVRDNDLTNCLIPVNVLGPRSAFTIIKDNAPANARATITGATPSVGSMPDGRVNVINVSATTVTNFVDGYEGQEIDLLFANGNTTVAHTANIFLQGSVNTTFTANTWLRLKFDGPLGVWYEIGRRT